MATRAAIAVPDYWDDACRHLGKRDRVMRKLIPRFGEARLQSRGDAFTTLERSIVGQQISVKAAQSVWTRFVELLGTPSTRISPKAVLAADAASLRGAGLSARKSEYLVDLAHHFDDGRVHVRQWQQMDDESIIEELVSIRGIGRWTAEMFLLFELERPDVWPVDDLGVRHGWRLIHEEAAPPAPRVLQAAGDRFRPYRSVVALFCWHAVHISRGEVASQT